MNDGHFLRTEKDRSIQGVTTLTLKQVSNDGIKLLSVKVEPSSFFLNLSDQNITKLEQLSLVIVKALKIKTNNELTVRLPADVGCLFLNSCIN